MRAMPKTLDTQGFSGLREEVVRSEGRTSCSPVLQALISNYFDQQLDTKSRNLLDSGIFIFIRFYFFAVLPFAAWSFRAFLRKTSI